MCATTVILSNYAEIANSLQKIGSKQFNQFDGETVVTALGLAAMIATRDFRFMSVMMNRVLELLKPADEALQKRNTDTNETLLLIGTCMIELRNFRNEATFVVISEPAAKRRNVRAPRHMDDVVVLEPT